MCFPCLVRVAITLCVSLCYLGALTLAPFDFTLATLANRTFIAGRIGGADAVFNVLGFVPLGAILYRFTRSMAYDLPAKWGFATSTAAAVSLSIETGQLFLPARVPAFADVLANTLGGGLGFWLAHYLRRRPLITYLAGYRRKLALLSIVGYLGVLTSLFLSAALPQRLDTWNPDYPFLIGNEVTLNRPWLGKLFFVGLYDRSLTATEVLSQFQIGPYFEPRVHLKGLPIALYTFQEAGGTHVYDRSPFGPPLDLEIVEPQKAVWLPNGGLELTGPTLLHSTQRPEKIYQRFTSAHMFSVAAWVQPKDALQNGPQGKGPARIVSYSPNIWWRNFTLGQAAREIEFRVRSRVAGPSGDRGYLQTKGLGIGPHLTHLVAVFDRGIEKLYVNGVLFPGQMNGDGLTVIAQTFQFDATSRWQRGLLVLLLLGPIGGLLWVLCPR